MEISLYGDDGVLEREADSASEKDLVTNQPRSRGELVDGVKQSASDGSKGRSTNEERVVVAGDTDDDPGNHGAKDDREHEGLFLML